MVSTYTSNFSMEKMATGDQSGTWGATTNHNWDIVDRLTAYLAVTLSSTSETLTVREASPGSGTENLQNGMYRVLKFIDSGDIGGGVTLTVSPNDVTAYYIVINSLSGSRDISITQGSGANFSVTNGKSAIVYCDGAGSGAAVVGAFTDPSFTTLDVTGAVALGSTLAVTGAITGSAGATIATEDSGTNTILYPAAIQRTSSATPAAGIGAGLTFVTETSAGNNETGSAIESVTTDVTGGAEIFDLVFKNMTAGATAAEVARMTGAGAFSVTGGATAALEDSGTNTVIDPLIVKRTSSATPANGIGAGIALVVETAAGNNETGATIDAVTTDVSSASEDFDLVFNLMAGGAAAAEKLRVKSTGKVAFANSAYASQQVNATATSNLTLDFDTYQNFHLTATGNVTLDNPTTESIGQSGNIVFQQDGTGSRTLSLGTQYYAPGGSLTISTTASAIDIIPYYCWAADKIILGTPQLAVANVS